MRTFITWTMAAVTTVMVLGACATTKVPRDQGTVTVSATQIYSN